MSGANEERAERGGAGPNVPMLLLLGALGAGAGVGLSLLMQRFGAG
jgi:hypothetical protein